VDRFWKGIIDWLFSGRIFMKFLDASLENLSAAELLEYEEIIELWITYGGD
jgi:succinate dehydrogenase flavin-adding protein (antitoxin of CptAB toxin-antitoxin module)